MTLRPREAFLDVIERVALEAADVPVLGGIGVQRCGFSQVGPRWCFVRPDAAFGVVLVTISGAGEGLVGNAWQPLGPEHAYVAPPGTPHGYRAVAGDPWHYVWAILDPDAAFPNLYAGRPGAHRHDAPSYAVAAAVRGLDEESRRAADPVLLTQWAALLRVALERLVRPVALDARLQRLWAHVNADLSAPWTIEDLGATAHLSREHLRRLCQRDCGCSPRAKLATLRLDRAAELLRCTDAKLSTVAEIVGFADAFSLSRAFKRRFGVTPSGYRAGNSSPPGVA